MSYLDTRGRRSVAVAFSYIEQKTEDFSTKSIKNKPQILLQTAKHQYHKTFKIHVKKAL